MKILDEQICRWPQHDSIRMAPRTDLTRYHEDEPSDIKPILDAITQDDRLRTASESFSRLQWRACEICQKMHERGAYLESNTTEETISGVTARELADTGRFSVTQQRLRQSLNKLDNCGYLKSDCTEPPHQFTIAHSCIAADTAEEATPNSASSPSNQNHEEETPTATTDDEQLQVSATNYQRASTLAAEAASNLTPRQRLVASLSKTSGAIVGIGSALLLAAGTQLSPHLYAAGESGLLAGATLLLGWLWLLFVGLVEGSSEESHENVALSGTA
ncbi:hypothetical protein [Halobacterium salinarum]|uniref:hypothetical protein n=1 Tax=Halobacterium salinarum TaxID=2242 RepID=UPI0025558821|nr:hypothetical protein [Halobacterium salinarum]